MSAQMVAVCNKNGRRKFSFFDRSIVDLNDPMYRLITEDDYDALLIDLVKVLPREKDREIYLGYAKSSINWYQCATDSSQPINGRDRNSCELF